MASNLLNLINDGSFELASPPSGDWSNIGTPTAVIRDTGERDNYGGQYSVKITSNGNGNEGIQATLEDLKASTKYTVRVRAKVTAGDTAKIWTTGGDTNLSETTTSETWVDLIGFFITDSTPANIVLNIGSDNATDIVWFDRLMIVEGSGAFEFTPKASDVGAIRVYRDVAIQITTMKKGVGSPPGDGLEDGFPTLDFIDSGDEEVFVLVHSPYDYAIGTDIQFHVEFFVDSVDINTQRYILWAVEYKVIQHGDVFDFGVGTGTTFDSFPIPITTDDKELMSCDCLIIPSAVLIGEGLLVVRLYRDGDGTLGTDDQSGDARLVYAHLHYTADKLGELV